MVNSEKFFPSTNYVQSKRFSKCEKELAAETFDMNSAAFAVRNELNNAISKLLFLSGAIVAVSHVCIEKYSSFDRTLNETCLF